MTQAAAARLLFLAALGTAGAQPAVAWQARFQGSPRIDAVALDRGGDFLVVKLSGAGGSELWRYRFAFAGAGQFDNGSVTALARHDSGNIIAVGASIAAELSGTTGEAMWFRALSGSVTNAVAVDGSD